MIIGICEGCKYINGDECKHEGLRVIAGGKCNAYKQESNDFIINLIDYGVKCNIDIANGYPELETSKKIKDHINGMGSILKRMYDNNPDYQIFLDKENLEGGIYFINRMLSNCNAAATFANGIKDSNLLYDQYMISQILKCMICKLDKCGDVEKLKIECARVLLKIDNMIELL